MPCSDEGSATAAGDMRRSAFKFWGGGHLTVQAAGRLTDKSHNAVLAAPQGQGHPPLLPGFQTAHQLLLKVIS